LLVATNPDTKEEIRVEPGAYRQRDVKVGRHVPISPGAIPRFMDRFESGYAGLGKTNLILASAAAHHRLAWIHPFLDGNGRVMRLMSHAVLVDALDTGGVWSIARGLARNVDDYKHHLAACDLKRRNDLDGRGNLSEEALADFIAFFLNICIDQVKFMEGLVQPEHLRGRILSWCEEETRADRLPPRSGQVLEALLYRGVLPRGDVAALLQTSPRNARRAVSALTDAGVLQAESMRAPLFLAFPAKLASRWMPGLFPDKP
jgi:Fic family protein